MMKFSTTFGQKYDVLEYIKILCYSFRANTKIHAQAEVDGRTVNL
jgi:hypothetical protein